MIILFILIIILIIVYFNYVKRVNNSKINKPKKIKIIKKVKNNNINNNKNNNINVDQLISKLEINDPDPNILFLTIGINGKPIGKIIVKLFDDIVPITCKNFRMLCMNSNNISYKGSPFHRIIKDFMIQGGDFTNEDGTGGISIYGENFKDENFNLKHDRPYLLSMANAGPNTNGSQFFITTNETPHLDGKHVVFGEVMEGFKLIDYLNNVNTDENDRPIEDIRILDCGIKS